MTNQTEMNSLLDLLTPGVHPRPGGQQPQGRGLGRHPPPPQGRGCQVQTPLKVKAIFTIHPRFILCSPMLPPPADCWCRGLVPATCWEVECEAWEHNKSHTCRAAPRPTSTTYLTPHPTFITCSGPPLLDRRLGDQPSPPTGGRLVRKRGHPVKDFETRYLLPPRSIEKHIW